MKEANPGLVFRALRARVKYHAGTGAPRASEIDD